MGSPENDWGIEDEDFPSPSLEQQVQQIEDMQGVSDMANRNLAYALEQLAIATTEGDKEYWQSIVDAAEEINSNFGDYFG